MKILLSTLVESYKHLYNNANPKSVKRSLKVKEIKYRQIKSTIKAIKAKILLQSASATLLIPLLDLNPRFACSTKDVNMNNVMIAVHQKLVDVFFPAKLWLSGVMS